MFVTINAASVKNLDVFCIVAITGCQGGKEGNWKQDFLTIAWNSFYECPDISKQNPPLLCGGRGDTTYSCYSITAVSSGSLLEQD